jgi:hypothetical protein
MRCELAGISKVDVLKIIGPQINDYYFLISKDGIFNWFDLEGNHIENPGVLKSIEEKYIPKTITKCIIPNGVTSIDYRAFCYCTSLKEIIIPNSVTSIDRWTFYRCDSLTSIVIPGSVINICDWVFNSCKSLKEVIFKGKALKYVKQMKDYPFGIDDKSIIKCEI